MAMKIEKVNKVATRKCPNCDTVDFLELEVHDSCWTVCCTKCFRVRGPYCNTPEEAVDEWNS
jgi:Zn ribbon nucleic-acid-binding protein